MVFVCRVTEIKQRDTNYEYMERIRFRINEICMLIPTDSVILVKIICADIQILLTTITEWIMKMKPPKYNSFD